MRRRLRYLIPLWAIALIVTRLIRRHTRSAGTQIITQTQLSPIAPPTPANAPRRNLGVLSQGDFRSLFLLIVSLLHGNIFIALTERVTSQVEPSSGWMFWTTTVFYYVLFFRIIQSQLAAAMKYDSAWRVSPFDYLVVFLTAIFEYVLFTHDRFQWASDLFRLRLLLGFSLFGAASYVFTYLRTRDEVGTLERVSERHIQSLNAGFMLASGALVCAAMVRPDLLGMVALNLALTTLLLCNIYVSMSLTLKLVQTS